MFFTKINFFLRKKALFEIKFFFPLEKNSFQKKKYFCKKNPSVRNKFYFQFSFGNK